MSSIRIITVDLEPRIRNNRYGIVKETDTEVIYNHGRSGNWTVNKKTLRNPYYNDLQKRWEVIFMDGDNEQHMEQLLLQFAAVNLNEEQVRICRTLDVILARSLTLADIIKEGN